MTDVPAQPRQERPELVRTFALVVPWQYCVSDNRKYADRSSKRLSDGYSEAKTAIGWLALKAMREQHVMKMRERLTARVFVFEPDRKRARDLTNLCKLLHDSLEKVAYENDAQLDDVRYVRGPVDRLNPRVEIMLHPIGEVHRP